MNNQEIDRLLMNLPEQHVDSYRSQRTRALAHAALEQSRHARSQGSAHFEVLVVMLIGVLYIGWALARAGAALGLGVS